MNRHLYLDDNTRTDLLDRARAPWRAAALLLGVALIAGCAASPEDIAPEFVSEAQYQDLTCEQISAERARVDAALVSATEKQEKARSDDIAGVIFLALPLGSMNGHDVEPEIAHLKGERDALDRSAELENCV
ncbi:MAG: hypothetical protein GY791_00825 [Alphaproteobacteria bacterium]|nr:hypothetical protein [Alphaproteobacteria bacterium]